MSNRRRDRDPNSDTNADTDRGRGRDRDREQLDRTDRIDIIKSLRTDCPDRSLKIRHDGQRDGYCGKNIITVQHSSILELIR